MNPLPPGIDKVLFAMVAHQILWGALSLEVRVQVWQGKTSKRSLADTPQPTPFKILKLLVISFKIHMEYALAYV